MRRRGRAGQWLVTDDYTGVTRYSGDVKQDYWGNYAHKPLARNVQEIASPLNDPQPVPFYRSPSYETVSTADFLASPIYVGETTTPSKHSYAGQVLCYDYGIGEMAVGSTFMVR